MLAGMMIFSAGLESQAADPGVPLAEQGSEEVVTEGTREAYETLRELYAEEGLAQEEIDELLVLDIKDADYFESQGVTVQHGGGGLFAADEQIMGWLFSH